MSHEWESGFVVREQAWHGLATVLEQPPTTAEGLKLAGLDWNVLMRPLFASDGVDWRALEVNSHRAVVRDRDNAILGVVGSDYVPVQNAEAFAFFDPLIERGRSAESRLEGTWFGAGREVRARAHHEAMALVG